MLPDQAGIKPVISWSQVGHASDWATKVDYQTGSEMDLFKF